MEQKELKNTIYIAETTDGLSELTIQKVKFDNNKSHDEIVILIEDVGGKDCFKVARLSIEEADNLRRVLDKLLPCEPPFANS